MSRPLRSWACLPAIALKHNRKRWSMLRETRNITHDTPAAVVPGRNLDFGCSATRDVDLHLRHFKSRTRQQTSLHAITRHYGNIVPKTASTHIRTRLVLHLLQGTRGTTQSLAMRHLGYLEIRRWTKQKSGKCFRCHRDCVERSRRGGASVFPRFPPSINIFGGNSFAPGVLRHDTSLPSGFPSFVANVYVTSFVLGLRPLVVDLLVFPQHQRRLAHNNCTQSPTQLDLATFWSNMN